MDKWYNKYNKGDVSSDDISSDSLPAVKQSNEFKKKLIKFRLQRVLRLVKWRRSRRRRKSKGDNQCVIFLLFFLFFFQQFHKTC